mmetsp:Transcript_20829/g.26349  ORF Transcript_20829/g.26349 Transcript_20829/m.26349 type:complete len:400 (-) Transcript_20829:50-1249(-)
MRGVHVNFLCLLSLCFYYSGVYCSTNATNSVWQGFEHHWERRALKIADTPHRMGSIANYIFNEAFQNTSSPSFQVNQTFTPGVNGDYCYPKTYFSLTSDVNVIHGVYDVAVQDNSTQGANPTASLSLSPKISVTLPQSGLNNANVEMLLQGWRIDMNCNPDVQPPGEICNSNGTWPYYMDLQIHSCGLSGAEFTCFLQVNFNRSCDPSCAYGSNLGIDKAFNHVMDYHFYVYYHIVYSQNMIVNRLDTISSEKITSEGNTYGTIVAQGNSGMKSATVGIRGFGFDLSPLLGKSIFEGKPGRYLESLTFKVEDVLYSADTGEFAFDWEMGYYTPLTTYPASGSYFLTPSVLQMSEHSVQHSSSSPAGGAVCVSDRFFKCKLNIDGVRLKETTNTVTTVQL